MLTQNPSIFFGHLPSGSYQKNMAILEFLFFEIWPIWAIFFRGKILCIGRNHIFQVKNSLVKETLGPSLVFLGSPTRLKNTHTTHIFLGVKFHSMW
jgi:hypothetical protein